MRFFEVKHWDKCLAPTPAQSNLYSEECKGDASHMHGAPPNPSLRFECSALQVGLPVVRFPNPCGSLRTWPKSPLPGCQIGLPPALTAFKWGPTHWPLNEAKTAMAILWIFGFLSVYSLFDSPFLGTPPRPFGQLNEKSGWPKVRQNYAHHCMQCNVLKSSAVGQISTQKVSWAWSPWAYL